VNLGQTSDFGPIAQVALNKRYAISGFQFQRKYAKIRAMQFLAQLDFAGTKCSIKSLPNPQYIPKPFMNISVLVRIQ
jgi:hypothetical protein